MSTTAFAHEQSTECQIAWYEYKYWKENKKDPYFESCYQHYTQKGHESPAFECGMIVARDNNKYQDEVRRKCD